MLEDFHTIRGDMRAGGRSVFHCDVTDNSGCTNLAHNTGKIVCASASDINNHVYWRALSAWENSFGYLSPAREAFTFCWVSLFRSCKLRTDSVVCMKLTIENGQRQKLLLLLLNFFFFLKKCCSVLFHLSSFHCKRI